MLDVRGLRKTYGGRTAVADVSLHVKAGQVLGLLGPNGAGKSTTVGMIAGLTKPDAGTVTVGGVALADDAFAFKRRIGLVPQDLALFDDLSALANVELFGALYGLKKPLLRQRALQALETVGLSDRAKDHPLTFSGGMKRRLNIACALVHDPDVLLLDEPTAGVDPHSRNAIFENLDLLRRAGKALVYTTHYMEEAERLADVIVIVDHGQVVASGTLAELYRALPTAQVLHIDIDDRPDAALPGGLAGGLPGADVPGFQPDVQPDVGLLDGLPNLRVISSAHGRLTVGVDDLARDTAAVLQVLMARGVKVRHVASGRANLEDVFLALTGRQLRD